MNTFWEVVEKIVNFISEFITGSVKKGNDVKDTLEIKSEIKTCEGLINRSYMAIGRKYYEMHKDGDFNPEFDKQFKEITNAKRAIGELEDAIEDIKNS